MAFGMNMVKTMLACACALTLCVGLGGCSGGSAGSSSASASASASASESASVAASEDAAEFVGKWSLYSISDGENEVVFEDASDEAKAKVGEVFIHLKEDGTALLSSMGQTFDGTWEANGPSKLRILQDGEEIYAATLEEGLMKLEAEGLTMLLARGE